MSIIEKADIDLERAGQALWEKLGLPSVGGGILNQAPLAELAPNGPFGAGEHLEIDYLIPVGTVCLAGEITARSASREVREKYRRFCRHLTILQNAPINDDLWRTLGVPEPRVREFREIESFRGFFATTRLERFDVDLEAVPNVIQMYRADMRLLEAYANAIGSFGKHVFLQMFQIVAPPAPHALTIRGRDGLIRLPGRQIAREAGTADLFTFSASPYHLLPIARVFRRDLLPDLGGQSEGRDYQRPLIPGKLEAMKDLVRNRDFVFPGSILVVLSDACEFRNGTLTIPGDQDAIAVIDGQHRLFSYADEVTRAAVGADARILVTAVRFTGLHDVFRDSGRMFVEINGNQTKVDDRHLDAISYPILGVTSARALAATLLLRANERAGQARGIFDTSQTSLGVIPTSTVLAALRPLCDLKRIERLSRARSERARSAAQGYMNLFGVAATSDLTGPEEFITAADRALTRFLREVARAFPEDWVIRGQQKHSMLYLAKGMAAMVRLFRTFVEEGADWQHVTQTLTALRANVLAMRGAGKGLVLDYTDPKIPSPQDPVGLHTTFLLDNRAGQRSAETLRRA